MRGVTLSRKCPAYVLVPLDFAVFNGSHNRACIAPANAQLDLKGSAVASDAFFPFRDGLDVVVDVGASCVIQPGGSMRDPEVIAAADERGVVMVTTGVRHFRH